MTATAPAQAEGRLTRLLAKQQDPYAGSDLANAKRYAGFVWVCATVISLALIPFAPPTAAFGRAGWAIFAAIIAATAIRTWALLRPESKIGFNGLYAGGYAGLAAIVVMVWLSGGQSTPYDELYVLGAVYAAGIHPLRRLLPYMALTALAAAAPIGYQGWSSDFFGDLLTHLAIWTTLVISNFNAMSRVRRGRVALRQHGEQAARQARIDSLTGLGNRRAFDELLEREFARSKRSEEPVCLLIFDLDGFKRLNDDFGHAHGDECLRTVADVLRRVMRRTDLCFRWGGDEFAAVLPDAEPMGAQLAAQRVRAELNRLSHRLAAPVTLSYGVGDGRYASTAEHMVALADEALLAAKRDQDRWESLRLSDDPPLRALSDAG
jgi:diguanylate cyclase (GGDEF)-like protein